MSFLGGIGNSLGGAIKNVAPALLRNVPNAVTAGLQTLADGFIDDLAYGMNNPNRNLPPPPGSIGN